MNRLRRRLQLQDGRKLLVPFFTAGFPSPAITRDLVRLAEDSGCDIVEIGMPFSDPMADGPEIQFSSYQALRHGVNLPGILDLVTSIRRHVEIPIVLMGYYNPVFSFGEARFLIEAHKAGVDGLIIPDLPVDEATEYRKAMVTIGLSAVFLVAPTSTPERVRLIDKMSTDLVYAVTVTGVTGTGKVFGAETDTYLKRLKRSLKRPFVAGFGVSAAASARRLARHSDGVVIGSELVRRIRHARNREAARRSVQRLLKEIREALL